MLACATRVVIHSYVYHMLFKVSYSESAYPITPVEPLKAILYDYFGTSDFCLLCIHINNIKSTFDKFKSAKFGLSILDMV